jgi:hypothetical protein
MRQDDSTVREAEMAQLIERLRATEHRGRFEHGGGTIASDGTCTSWGGERIMELRNPDGPAAADMLEALAALESSPADGATGGVRAEVIEECARVADEQANEKSAHPEYNMGCWDAANAIRALTPAGTGEEG